MKALFRFMLVLAVVPMIWSCSDDDDGTSDTTPTYTIQGSANVVGARRTCTAYPTCLPGRELNGMSRRQTSRLRRKPVTLSA